MAIPRFPAPPEIPLKHKDRNFASVAEFASRADAWLAAMPSLFVLDNCSWCRSVLGKLDRNKCCANCGGPRE